MIKHCPTCDRTSDKVHFIGEFCEVCVTDKLKKSIPNSVDISYCKRCGRIRIPGRHAAIDRITLMNAIVMGLPSTKAEIDVLSFDEKTAKVEFMINIDGNYAKFIKELDLRMKHAICRDCMRKSSGYFEATVQLRGNDEVIQKIIKKLTVFLDDREAFVTKAEKVQGGWDIYTSDKKLTQGFFRLHELKPKRSATLFTIKDGKELYRDTYALRV